MAKINKKRTELVKFNLFSPTMYFFSENALLLKSITSQVVVALFYHPSYL
jgi:hypothetical protein